MPFEGGPYIQAACFCDTVIEDKTGSLSLIRVIDTLTHVESSPSPPEDMPPVTHHMKLVVMLKPGKARGRHNLEVVPELPTGETREPLAASVHFEGAERGTNVVADFYTTFEYEGLYWFHVYLDNEELTRIPFRVKYNRVIVGSTSGQTAPSKPT